MRLILLSLLVSGCATTTAPPQQQSPPPPLDGNRLYSMLIGTTADRVAGLNYVAGVADAENAYASAVKGLAIPDASIALMICFPPTAVHQQASDVVLQYMQANPTQRHQTAYSLTRAALNKAWPCKS